MTAGSVPPTWQPTLGAIASPGGITFRVWAPDRETIELVIRDDAGERAVPLAPEGEYRVAEVAALRPGARYGYIVDGRGPFPDPCSRSQPDGPHGLSEVVDPTAFAWTDDAWAPPDAADLVVYECHVGTLTEGGTFEAAIGQLTRLKDLGITAIELLPVASFPGHRNWGYDGVSLFAPVQVYGGAHGLRRLVNAAHASGLAVILDVVYNHLGPDGNYTGVFSDRYVTPKHSTPWGDAINFDDEGSAEVRRFFVENALHWVHEYHIDGFRFDATHTMVDGSPRHILAELSDALRGQPRIPGHPPYLIAESHENDVRYLTRTKDGGFGFDAVWADDFHNEMRVLLLGERDGYFASFQGTAEELGRTIAQGFLYEGQFDPWPKEPRGTPARRQPWREFVYCIQNHDQVGNRAFGQRLNASVSHADYLAATVLLLLLPQTPMLFQGQEFLSSSPFLYFTDHNPELGRLVTEGRRREFGRFAAFADPAVRQRIPDPQDPDTFQRSRLRLDEAEYGLGALCQDLHGELLHLRADDPALREARRGRPLLRTTASDRALMIEFGEGEGRRVIAANFGEAAQLPVTASSGLEIRLHSAEPRWGGNAVAPVLGGGIIRLPAHSAAFLSPRNG